MRCSSWPDDAITFAPDDAHILQEWTISSYPFPLTRGTSRATLPLPKGITPSAKKMDASALGRQSSPCKDCPGTDSQRDAATAFGRSTHAFRVMCCPRRGKESAMSVLAAVGCPIRTRVLCVASSVRPPRPARSLTSVATPTSSQVVGQNLCTRASVPARRVLASRRGSS
jgi:hypothetical protein